MQHKLLRGGCSERISHAMYGGLVYVAFRVCVYITSGMNWNNYTYITNIVYHQCE